MDNKTMTGIGIVLMAIPTIVLADSFGLQYLDPLSILGILVWLAGTYLITTATFQQKEEKKKV
jgi:hypothetical protein